MIEQKRSPLLFSTRQDSDFLQQRASRQRQRHQEYAQSVRAIRQHATLLLTSPAQSIRRLPSRVLLHLVVALLLPVAVVLGALPLARQAEPASVLPTNPVTGDLPLGLGPIALDTDGDTDSIPALGDPPLADDDAIPMPLSLTSRSEALAPLVVQASVGGETARLRTGPGLEYDEVGKVAAGTPLEVIGRFGDWFQVREGEGMQVSWMAAEVVAIPDAAVSSLFDVPAETIPAPPPPKVASVLEEGLNLRDGPGTNYVGMIKLDNGTQLSLLEQYQDWMHVATSDNRSGWVKTEFLGMLDGVLPRVPVTDQIPDANPAMVGWVRENGVSLRKGPGSNYPKLGAIGDAQVQLVARYKDWFKIQTANGTTAWMFSDFLEIPPMVQRRIATTNDIPALPQIAQRTTRTTKASNGQSPRAAVAAPSIAASGDVAGYAVQFVGYRYRWGGSSPAGFDCSGLTSYVYSKHGVRLPHSAAGQLSPAYGAVIGSIGNLAPGDLVFFAGTTGGRGISHVAIYIGGGRIVHAMTPRLGVQVSNIRESYWVSHFYAGLRPYR